MATTQGANLAEALTEATAASAPEQPGNTHQRNARRSRPLGRERWSRRPPADFTGMDLRGLKGLAHRSLTALIAPNTLRFTVWTSKAQRSGQQSGGC